MAGDSRQPESLGNDPTRSPEVSRADLLRPQRRDESGASLNSAETDAGSLSSLSDLGTLGPDPDSRQEFVDLESRYDIGELIGRGGMGEVVRAVDRRLKRPVAIKRMRPEFGESRQALRRFFTEAVSIAALSHFNIVQIFDYGHSAGGPFLVMELVEGPTLATRLAEGPLPLDAAIDLACQLCRGLQAAHDAGIIHRDIKPANILLAADGTPKLTDFGLAKEVTDPGHTKTGVMLGTVDYMAPEQKANASQVDARSDQWSLAATLYQMVTGRPPRVIRLDELPVSLQPVVEQALEEDPAARFESVRDFADALRNTASPAIGTPSDQASLQEGQCASCGIINDIDRRYCRQCGESLLGQCPDCNARTTVWEKFCGGCGLDIPAFLAEQIRAADELATEVETLRAGYRHAVAVERLAPLLNTIHPALAERRQWAERTREQLKGELAELHRQRDQLLQAARDEIDAGSYSAARMTLAGIPENLQDGKIQELQRVLSDFSTEVRQLQAEIAEATRSRNYAGLEARVARYLELKPHDQRAARFLKKLQHSDWEQFEPPPPPIPPQLPRKPATSPKSRISSLAVAGAAAIFTVILIRVLMQVAIPNAWERDVNRSTVKPISSRMVRIGAPAQSSTSRPGVETPALEASHRRPRLFNFAEGASSSAEAQMAQQTWANHWKMKVVETNTIGMQLAMIPPGEFLMGSPASEVPRDSDEFQHRVRISQPFYLQVTEVTQEQWALLMQSRPWKNRRNVKEDPLCPATYVSWIDARTFCQKLTNREGVSYRLPTESEWEFACRAGTITAYSFGDSVRQLERFAWFRDNTIQRNEPFPHPVAQRLPNHFGLFDMHGNVSEWCHDVYGEYYYRQFTSQTLLDPSGPSTLSSSRIYQGGSWNSSSGGCRSASRDGSPQQSGASNLGFRVVREISLPQNGS